MSLDAKVTVEFEIKNMGNEKDMEEHGGFEGLVMWLIDGDCLQEMVEEDYKVLKIERVER